MPRIITNVQTAPVPGFWQRLAALQADSDAGDGLDLVRQLETMNIPRDQRAVVHAVRSWDALELSPIVAFAIWLLRDRQEDDGSFKRRPHSAMAETPTASARRVVLVICSSHQLSGCSCNQRPTLSIRSTESTLSNRSVP